jgi:hypothetical protein
MISQKLIPLTSILSTGVSASQPCPSSMQECVLTVNTLAPKFAQEMYELLREPGTGHVTFLLQIIY